MTSPASSPPRAPTAFDDRGRAFRLGVEVGRGGEGVVYEVEGHPDLVAKLYHRPPVATHADKLRAMAGLASAELRRAAAWPVATLHPRPGGAVLGVLMPRVAGHRPIHHLYGPRSRRKEFPEADWRFLVRVAANLARTFAVIHAHGQVIGDVNQGNVLVAPSGSVVCIDCDSFQVERDGRRYPCEVGVATYQPPELQGLATFRGIARTPNHDAFGLAVLIFQLLMLGRHPFAGTHGAREELTIERAILEYCFAYGRGAGRSIHPPPLSPPLDVVSPPVAALFELAFAPAGANGRRPRATAWARALDGLLAATVICPRNLGHAFHRDRPACPWCDLERRAGTVVFAAKTLPPPASPPLDLDAVWAEVEAVSGPGPAPPLPTVRVGRRRKRPSLRGKPSPLGRAHTFAFPAVALIALLTGVGSALGHDWSAVVVAAAGGLAAGAVWLARIRGDHVEAAARRRARENWRALAERWARETGDEAFQEKRRALDAARRAYLALANPHQDPPRHFAALRRERQLDDYLGRRKVVGAGIKGVGPGREAVLASYGIETAADVTESAIRAIPGFGRGLADEILAWRRDLEAAFTFNPDAPIEPDELRAFEREVRDRREQLAQTLRRGAADLRALADQARRNRTLLRPEVDRALAALASRGGPHPRGGPRGA